MARSNLHSWTDETYPGVKAKLWIYTNFDCNLHCSYCVARSNPRAARREIGLDTVKRLVDEAVSLCIDQVYFTGGEPLLVNDLWAMLAYSSARLPTVLLTNATLLRGKRFESLCSIRNDNLTIQVSLDGACPEQHDPYRGAGSWVKTVEGIDLLRRNSFTVHLSTTETPANSAHLAEICTYHQSLGILEDEHIVRPLAKRGFSPDGMQVGKYNLSPEITVTQTGIYWHPLSTDADMMVSDRIFPLAEAVCKVSAELNALNPRAAGRLQTFQ